MLRFNHDTNSWEINYSGRGIYWEPIPVNMAREYAATFKIVFYEPNESQ